MSAYDQGYEAAKAGKPFTYNPYSKIDRSQRDFMEWFAGWCWFHRADV